MGLAQTLNFGHKKTPLSYDNEVLVFGADTKSRTRDLLITSHIPFRYFNTH